MPALPSLRLGHAGLNVRDMDRSLRFYTDVLGLAVIHEVDDKDRRYAFLRLDDGLLTLWQQASGAFDTRGAGLHHLAFRVADAAALASVRDHLTRLHVPIRHGGIVAHSRGSASAALFFSDPDGVRLEVYADEAGEGHPPPDDGPACGMF